MRRIDKQCIKVIRELDLVDVLEEVKEFSPEEILRQQDEVHEQEFYQKGGRMSVD